MFIYNYKFTFLTAHQAIIPTCYAIAPVVFVVADSSLYNAS